MTSELCILRLLQCKFHRQFMYLHNKRMGKDNTKINLAAMNTEKYIGHIKLLIYWCVNIWKCKISSCYKYNTWMERENMTIKGIKQYNGSTFPSEAWFPISSFSSCRVLHLAISIFPILLWEVNVMAVMLSCKSFIFLSFSSTKFW